MTAQPRHSRSFVTLLRDRNKLLRQRLADQNIDALMLSNRKDIRYLTGFVGDDSLALVPIDGKGKKPVIISDFRFEEQIPREAPDARLVIRKDQSLPEAALAVADKQGWQRLGLQQDHVTLGQQKRLRKQFKAKRLKVVNDRLLDQRSIKTPIEIEHISRALMIQQRAFEELKAFAQPGMTENELAAYLEYRMRALGADGCSFPTIMAVDANAALPHAIPGATKLRKHAMLLVDWGAKSCGYCSDLTRVLFFGQPRQEIKEIYQVVLDAQLAAIDAIRPGMAFKEADAVARRHIEEAGYGDYFGHSLGHGIGLDIHESPTLSARSKGELQPGQVVTVEPGIYLPGVGGVRIEDDVLITDKGAKVLSRLPKDFESAMVE